LTWAAAALPARPIQAEQGLGCHHHLLQGRRQATLKVEAVQLTDTGSQRSSAVIAILLREPGYERLRDGLAASEQASTGAPSGVESSLVLCARLGRAGKTLLARFLEEAEIQIVEFTGDHWAVAADAFVHYGNGSHGAGLNFGDCMTCAVAKLGRRAAPLPRR
jgi:ribonuclease VapC